MKVENVSEVWNGLERRRGLDFGLLATNLLNMQVVSKQYWDRLLACSDQSFEAMLLSSKCLGDERIENAVMIHAQQADVCDSVFPITGTLNKEIENLIKRENSHVVGVSQLFDPIDVALVTNVNQCWLTDLAVTIKIPSLLISRERVETEITMIGRLPHSGTVLSYGSARTNQYNFGTSVYENLFYNGDDGTLSPLTLVGPINYSRVADMINAYADLLVTTMGLWVDFVKGGPKREEGGMFLGNVDKRSIRHGKISYLNGSVPLYKKNIATYHIGTINVFRAIDRLARLRNTHIKTESGRQWLNQEIDILERYLPSKDIVIKLPNWERRVLEKFNEFKNNVDVAFLPYLARVNTIEGKQLVNLCRISWLSSGIRMASKLKNGVDAYIAGHDTR